MRRSIAHHTGNLRAVCLQQRQLITTASAYVDFHHLSTDWPFESRLRARCSFASASFCGLSVGATGFFNAVSSLGGGLADDVGPTDDEAVYIRKVLLPGPVRVRVGPFRLTGVSTFPQERLIGNFETYCARGHICRERTQYSRDTDQR